MQNRRSSLEAATSTDSLLVATLNYPSTLAHDRQILILKNPISETLLSPTLILKLETLIRKTLTPKTFPVSCGAV